MSRTAYAARTLVSEIRATFPDTVTVSHVGEPDGWGTIKSVQVDGAAAERVRISDVLNYLNDNRVHRTSLVGESLIIDLVPRADDPREFGIRRRVNATG